MYNQHKAVYKKYKSHDPKKRGAYKEKHVEEISQYESALTYIKENLNGYSKIPEKDWRAERDKLLAERYAHCDDYYKLREDIKNVEALRRGADSITRDIMPQRMPTRTQDISH